jgi:hypothetical protein
MKKLSKCMILLEIDPNDVNALNNKGAALSKLERSQEAIE